MPIATLRLINYDVDDEQHQQQQHGLQREQRERSLAAGLRADLPERPIRSGWERLFRGESERPSHAASRLDQEGSANERLGQTPNALRRPIRHRLAAHQADRARRRRRVHLHGPQPLRRGHLHGLHQPRGHQTGQEEQIRTKAQQELQQ